jgi:hypothetical protein
MIKRIKTIESTAVSVVSCRSRTTSFFGIGNDFEKLTLLPRNAIIVPEKPRVSSNMSDLLQVTKFASQTTLTAAALSVTHCGWLQ